MIGYAQPCPNLSEKLGEGPFVGPSGGDVSPRHYQQTLNAHKRETVLSRARAIIADGQEEAFAVMDVGVVRAQAARWKRELPRVRPLYAIKCNPEPKVIHALASEGFGFDVASKREMELVKEHAVDLGLIKDVANDVIYANPCKQVSHIRAVSQMGVEMTTLDNIDEVRKLHKHWPNAKIVIRILGADDSASICGFNCKFGLPVDEVPTILAEAKKLNMSVVGISFHVGSGCTSPVPFVKAVENARRAFDMFKPAGLPAPYILDLGGGWPGTLENAPDKYASFEDIAALLRPTLDKLFPADSGVTIVAEPGRYFVSSSTSLYTAVHARREVNVDVPELVSNHSLHDGSSTGGDESPTNASASLATQSPQRGFRLYINDGTYGSFNCISNDHVSPQPGALIHADGNLYAGKGPLLDCSLWGPTCDGVDKISASMPLPELAVGDWIEWPTFGAYTGAAAAHFNGITPPTVIHINP